MTAPSITEPETLKSLLEAQAKALSTVDETDDVKSITKKLLKLHGELEPSATTWCTASYGVLQNPYMWFFLLSKEGSQAAVAINSFIQSFSQRHLSEQLSSVVLAMAATVALTRKAKDPLTAYEAFTIVEPLVGICAHQLQYLQAKRLAATSGVTAGRLLAAISSTSSTFSEKLDAAAQKLRKEHKDTRWHKDRRGNFGRKRGRNDDDDDY